MRNTEWFMRMYRIALFICQHCSLKMFYMNKMSAFLWWDYNSHAVSDVELYLQCGITYVNWSATT